MLFRGKLRKSFIIIDKLNSDFGFGHESTIQSLFGNQRNKMVGMGNIQDGYLEYGSISCPVWRGVIYCLIRLVKKIRERIRQ